MQSVSSREFEKILSIVEEALLNHTKWYDAFRNNLLQFRQELDNFKSKIIYTLENVKSPENPSSSENPGSPESP